MIRFSNQQLKKSVQTVSKINLLKIPAICILNEHKENTQKVAHLSMVVVVNLHAHKT